jgi:hypothetical protein
MYILWDDLVYKQFDLEVVLDNFEVVTGGFCFIKILCNFNLNWSYRAI